MGARSDILSTSTLLFKGHRGSLRPNLGMHYLVNPCAESKSPPFRKLLALLSMLQFALHVRMADSSPAFKH